MNVGELVIKNVLPLVSTAVVVAVQKRRRWVDEDVVDGRCNRISKDNWRYCNGNG